MKVSRFALFLLAGVALTRAASAATPLITPATLSWARPTSVDAAAASNTTYQEWDGFSSVSGPNAPTAIYNPNPTITANAYDSNQVDPDPDQFTSILGFPTGDMYTSSTAYMLQPRAIIGGYGIAGNVLNVVVDLQSFGAIDTSGLLVNGVLASTLSGYSYTQLSSTDTDSGGHGDAPIIDNQWTFAVPDTTSLQLDWTWGDPSTGLGVSVAWQDLSIDTQSVASSVPEPASLGLLASGAALLIFKRGRRR